MFVVDGSYFKIKTITLGYQFQDVICKKLHIARAKVYAMADNIMTFKNSSMPNPELVNQIGIYTGGAFQTPFRFTLGLDITF